MKLIGYNRRNDLPYFTLPFYFQHPNIIFFTQPNHFPPSIQISFLSIPFPLKIYFDLQLHSDTFHLEQFLRKQKMQLKFYQSTHYSSLKTLQKSTSMPSFIQTSASSSDSIDCKDDHYRQLTIKWILSYNKKVTKDTQYLAIAYLNQLQTRAIHLTSENYQQIGVTLLLIASKMNEIYPPKIESMIARCQRMIKKEEIIEMEGKIIAALDYQTALEDTPYTLINKMLGKTQGDRLADCQKLLRIVLPDKQVQQSNDEILAYAIVYLIIPQFVKGMRLKQADKVKTLAIKIYNLYQQTKEKYDRQKENRGA